MPEKMTRLDRILQNWVQQPEEDSPKESSDDVFERVYGDIPNPDTPKAEARREARGRTPPDPKRKKLQEDIRTGRYIHEGVSPLDRILSGAMWAAREGQRVATGEIVIDPALRALGVDPEGAEEGGQQIRTGAGTAAGFVQGMKAGAAFPHPAGAPIGGLLGAITGAAVGHAAGSPYAIDKSGVPLPTDPISKRELAEAASMSLGSASVLNTLSSKFPVLWRMAIGGAEAAAINETTMQTISSLEEGKPLPLDAKSVWDRNKIALGLGGLVGKFAKGKTTFDPTEVRKATSKIEEELKTKIKEVERKGRNKTSTRGKRNAAKRLAKTLRQDLNLIKSNPEALKDNSNPKQMQRILTILRNRAALQAGIAGEKNLNRKRILENEILYLNSLGGGDAEKLARSLVKLGKNPTSRELDEAASSYSGINPKELITNGQRIEKFGDGWLGTQVSKVTDPVFRWANARPEDSLIAKPLKKIQAFLTLPSIPMMNRLYLGTADILERGSQRSGGGERGVLFQLAKGLRRSVDDGNYMSADLQGRLLRKAEGLGYGSRKALEETKKANEEFADFMKIRHTEAGGIRGDVKEGIPVSENMRIARAKKFYDEMTPMGRALVDGWDEASGMAGAKMKSLGVVVQTSKGDWRPAVKHSSYFPRRLKQEFEELIDDDFRLYDAKGEGSPEVQELLRVFGVRDKNGLKGKLEKYIDFKNEVLKEGRGTSNFYNHLERARELTDMPPDSLDFSIDMGASYLDNSARSLAQIEHFGGQANKVGGRNENFIFHIIEDGVKDKKTKEYVEKIRAAIFSPTSDDWVTAANRGTTFAFIANPLTAAKNLTGAFKTWTITGTAPMAEATLRQLGDTISEVGHKLRGINREAPHLAERVGATSSDIGRITALVDNQSLTRGARAGDTSLVGAALKYTGFTPAEDFVRKQGTLAADLARREWMELFDKSPNASSLIAAVNKLHANPSNEILRNRVEKLIRQNPTVNKKLAEAARFTAKQNIDLKKMADERFAKVQTMGQPKDVPMTFDPEAHPETRRFLQSWTKETQGGYMLDQLPLFMQNDTWKTFFKFMNWGQQMQRHLHKNIIGEAKNGNYKPLMKWLAATQLAGETVGKVKEAFGKDREDAGYPEIAKAFETEAGKGTLLLLNRMLNNAALGGQWDLLGGYIGGNYLRYKKTGSFDPISVPAIDAVNNIVKTAAAAKETGLSSKTVDEASRVISAIRTGRDLVKNIRSYQPQRYDIARKKLRRFVKDRFTKSGLAFNAGYSGSSGPQLKGTFSPTLEAARKSDIVKAVQSGNHAKARRLADEFISDEVKKPTPQGWVLPDNEKRRGLISDALEYTVTRSQPLRAGTSTSPKVIEALKQYMIDTRFGDRDEVLALQKQYTETAIRAGLMKPDEEKTRTDEYAKEGEGGRYGSDRVEAEARRFVERHEEDAHKFDKVRNISPVVKKADTFYRKHHPPIPPPKGRQESEEEKRKREKLNLERSMYVRNVIVAVRNMASARLKEDKQLATQMPKGFESIRNSFTKAEALEEHLDKNMKGGSEKDRKKFIEKLYEAGLMSKKDLAAYFEYIKK